MKRGATREEIIHTTQELIARNGIRAIRVDELAQKLSISKRTLYELFEDKTGLVNACLEDMWQQQQFRIVTCNKRRSGNPLQNASRVVHEYIDSLFAVESSFLRDIRRKLSFSEHFAERREFWCCELSRTLENCRNQELLLPDIDAPLFADRILTSLFQLRINYTTTADELYLFSRTILRGAATRQGVEAIDCGR